MYLYLYSKSYESCSMAILFSVSNMRTLAFKSSQYLSNISIPSIQKDFYNCCQVAHAVIPSNNVFMSIWHRKSHCVRHLTAVVKIFLHVGYAYFIYTSYEEIPSNVQHLFCVLTIKLFYSTYLTLL